MNLLPNRLILAREALGINKAEAARRLNMSAMGYGRYEKGERVPSYQTICFIANAFETTPEYLCGETDVSKAMSITVNFSENPDLFLMVEKMKSSSSDMLKRLLVYMEQIE